MKSLQHTLRWQVYPSMQQQQQQQQQRLPQEQQSHQK